MKVVELEPKELKCEQNVMKRSGPKLTVNVSSLDHWPHLVIFWPRDAVAVFKVEKVVFVVLRHLSSSNIYPQISGAGGAAIAKLL